MAHITSNLGEIRRRIMDVAGCLNMNAVGRYDRVGVDALDIMAEGIADRTLNQQAEPSGGPLAALAASTLTRKRRLGQPDTIGVATGHMLAQEQLKGERDITSTQATSVFGVDELAKDEATWFSEGRKKGPQPARPFYELDDQIDAQLDEFVDEVVSRAVERNGG